MRRLTLVFALLTCLAVTGCSNMDPERKYLLTGAVAGAATGTVIGAGLGDPFFGGLIGTAVGGVAGLLYSDFWKEEIDQQLGLK